MRILLSAYACNPYKGSEPGIGWHWAFELSKMGYEVYVITRLKNKRDIENYVKLNPDCKKIRFIFHDLPPVILKFKKVLGVYLYYELWQITVLNKVKINHKEFKFDLIHHLTFGSFRQPSYLHKVGLPFYFGPVGGGELSPKLLLKELPLKNRIKESIRYYSNAVSLRRKSLNGCFKSSRIIFCKTVETLNVIPEKYKSKSILQNDIGQDLYNRKLKHRVLPPSTQPLNILFVGRLLSWKGPHLAILAFQELKKKSPNAILTFVGDGTFSDSLKRIVKENNLSNSVFFKGNIEHQLIEKCYNTSDIFIFPSLHDSSGTVILEALNSGLPTICLKTGGPLFLLTKDCPTIVDCVNMTQEAVVNGLARMLTNLASDSVFYEDCSKWSLRRINELTWSGIVRKAYYLIEEDYHETGNKN